MGIGRFISAVQVATAAVRGLGSAADDTGRKLPQLAVTPSRGGDDAVSTDRDAYLRNAAGLGGATGGFSRGSKGGSSAGPGSKPTSSSANSTGAKLEKEIAKAMQVGGIIGVLIEEYVNLLRSGNEVEATKMEPYLREWGGDALRSFPFGSLKKWFRPKKSLPTQSGSRAGSVSIDQLMAQGRL